MNFRHEYRQKVASIDSNFIHHPQRLETNQMSCRGWMNKKICVISISSNKKETANYMYQLGLISKSLLWMEKNQSQNVAYYMTPCIGHSKKQTNQKEKRKKERKEKKRKEKL